MLIREIITEDYADDLVSTVQDMLALLRDDDVTKISTEEFANLMAEKGYNMSTDEVIAAVDQSGYANSVDAETIVPLNTLPDEMGSEEPDPDAVANMAQDQAMKDVKSEL